MNNLEFYTILASFGSKRKCFFHKDIFYFVKIVSDGGFRLEQLPNDDLNKKSGKN